MIKMKVSVKPSDCSSCFFEISLFLSISLSLSLSVSIESEELQRKFTRIACDPLTCKPGVESSNEQQDDIEIELISGLLDENIERVLVKALDGLCPALESTPKLQDKAFRLVFSVGMDVIMLDAENSGIIDKFALKQEDMISSDESDEVFGVFCIPSMNSLKKISSGSGSDNSGGSSNGGNGGRSHSGNRGSSRGGGGRKRR
jgi:uncharacterized membrane protein YgcG